MRALGMSALCAIAAASWSAATYAENGACAVTLFAGGVYGTSQHVMDNGTNLTNAFTIDGNGAGIGFGCRRANGPWVGAVEADFMRTTAQGTAQDRSGDESHTEVDNVTTIRLLGGFAVRPALLVYLTGGLASASIKATVCETPGASCMAESHRHWGGVFGGGAEYAFTRRISARLEYLWLGLDDKAYFEAQPLTSGIANRGGGVSPRVEVIRAGLSWYF